MAKPPNMYCGAYSAVWAKTPKEDIDKEALLEMRYHQHLWMEKEIKSVANVTHWDLAEFLPLAVASPLRPEVTAYPLEQANQALHEFKHGQVRGAKVLQIGL